MGITRGTTRLLLEESKRKPFGGSLLELGKMFVFLGDKDLSHWARVHQVELTPGVEFQSSHDPVLAAQGCLGDRYFFERLGFDEVTSLDAAPWEGADVITDMNLPVAEDLHGRFDVIFEGGTLHSIFHLPNVLANIHAMLRPGGRMIHAMTASHNQVDLGFYMLSPTFFMDYYRANGWHLEKVLLCEHVAYWIGGKLETGPWDIYEYTTGCLDHLSFGRYGGKQLSIFAVATKTEDSRCDVIPQQGYYQALWREDREARLAEQEARARKIASRSWLYDSAAYSAYKHLTERLRRSFLPRRMPPRVARY
ncbi:MAG: class I SAM-dependent methyltransferase [Acidobacteriota bacterium]